MRNNVPSSDSSARRLAQPLGVMVKRHLILHCTLSLTALDAGACVAVDPVGTARWIYTNQRSFAFQSLGEDLGKRVGFVSPTLYELLRAEWRCQDAEQGIGNLDSDPWINAQAGNEREPITFELASTTRTTATVHMRFQYVLNPPTAVPSKVILKFTKSAKSGCWLLDDLVGIQGRSLKKQLQPDAP